MDRVERTRKLIGRWPVMAVVIALMAGFLLGATTGAGPRDRAHRLEARLAAAEEESADAERELDTSTTVLEESIAAAEQLNDSLEKRLSVLEDRISALQSRAAVPDIEGESLAVARRTLSQAGFEVGVEKKRSNQPPGTVLSQGPAGGVLAEEGSTVRLSVAKPKPIADEGIGGGGSSSGGGCDPNYSGCVPVYPPDVDCDRVKGPVTVVGNDPHNLDGNHDGQACEGPPP